MATGRVLSAGVYHIGRRLKCAAAFAIAFCTAMFAWLLTYPCRNET